MGYEATANSGSIIPMANVGTASLTAAGFMYSGAEASSGNNVAIDMTTVSETESYEVTIAPSAVVSGNVTIATANGFIGNANTRNNCKLFAEDAAANGTNYSVTVGDNDVFTFTNTNKTYTTLQYNASSPRFAVYQNSQKNFVVYKKSEESTGAKELTFVPGVWNKDSAQFAAVTWKRGQNMVSDGVMTSWMLPSATSATAVDTFVVRIPADADSIAFARFTDTATEPMMVDSLIWNHTDIMAIDPSLIFTIAGWGDAYSIGYWGAEPNVVYYLRGSMSNWNLRGEPLCFYDDLLQSRPFPTGKGLISSVKPSSFKMVSVT